MNLMLHFTRWFLVSACLQVNCNDDSSIVGSTQKWDDADAAYDSAYFE